MPRLVLGPRLERGKSARWGANQPTILLAEPDSAARRERTEQLERIHVPVAGFSDPHDAFLFLLGHLDEVCVVLVPDTPDERVWRLRRRLEALPASPPLWIYQRAPSRLRPGALRALRGLK